MNSSDLWSLVDCLRREALLDPQLRDLPRPLREGRVLASVLERLPIGIPAGATLAGEFGWQYCSAQERQRLEETDARGETPPASAPTPLQLMDERFHCRVSNGGSAHTTVDYARVVNEGLAGVLAEIAEEAVDAPPAKREHLGGMRAALEGLIRWAERYAELAERLADSAAGAAERDRLLGLAETCRHVPRHGARTLREAIQAVWFVHLGVGLSEHSGSSLSLGRPDQYLYPLYQRDVERGVAIEELEGALAGLFRALNAFFGDPACAVNLGPVGAEPGGFNDLSELMLRVAKELRLPSPILAVRVSDDAPAEVLDLFVDPDLFAIGQPTFYGEAPCRQALLRRGVPQDEVAAWAVNSCMGLMMPGREWSNMWGSVVNCLLAVELAVNGGRPFLHDLPLRLSTHAPETYEAFDQLFEVVSGYMAELVDLCVRETAQRTERRGLEQPNPFVSALLRDCIARGRDRLLGGCRHHTVIVEGFGLVNAADALLAVRRLAFGSGRCSLAALVEAAKDDFAGRLDVLKALRAAPKYGDGDPEADAMARRLAERFARAVSRHSTAALCWAPSFHTLTQHIPAGRKMAASLDGRRAGQPLAKNVGASPGRATLGHTALMRSAAAVDQSAFFGGQALDISIDPRTIRDAAGKRKFQALLRTYFALGGLQVQVNGVTADTLRRALQAPDSRRDLIVRIAGYSQYFHRLDRSTQQELVARFEHGM